MKYLIKNLPTGNKSHQAHIKEKKYTFLCLENLQDAEWFVEINSKMKSKQAVGWWMGYKTFDGPFHKDPIGYDQHESESGNGIGSVLATQLALGVLKGTLIDYCNASDKIIIDMNNTILKWINQNKFVRINKDGGYCSIEKEEIEEYETVKDINEEEALTLLLHKDLNFEMKITRPTLVIENFNYIPKTCIEVFSKHTNSNLEDIQTITSFKYKTILFNEKDYFNFFKEGFENGLKNLVFETTAQDSIQILKIKRLLESLMSKFTSKVLNVYVRISSYHKDKIEPYFKTNLSNIKVHFLTN